MKPTKENCIGRKARFKHPNSTVFLIVAVHPAIPHFYWEAPGYSGGAGSLDEIEFVVDGTPFSDMRPLKDRHLSWTTSLHHVGLVEEKTVTFFMDGKDTKSAFSKLEVVDAPKTALPLPEEGIVFPEVYKSFVEQALKRTDGNQSKAAKLLGISRYALRGRAKAFGFVA
jgi:hypothetical protein